MTDREVQRDRTRVGIAMALGAVNGLLAGGGWAGAGLMVALAGPGASVAAVAAFAFAWPAATWLGFHLAWVPADRILRGPAWNRDAAREAAWVGLHLTVPMGALYALAHNVTQGFRSTPGALEALVLIVLVLVPWSALMGVLAGATALSPRIAMRTLSEVGALGLGTLVVLGTSAVLLAELRSPTGWLLVPLVVCGVAIYRKTKAARTGRAI